MNQDLTSEGCLSFCWSTVCSRVLPWTMVCRAQTSYGISLLFVVCFAGVTVQRSEVTSCNFTAPIATFGASSNPREFLLHPNRTQISQPRQSDGSRCVTRAIRSCAWLGCYEQFIPRSPRQKFCSKECQRAMERVLERERRWRQPQTGPRR
jgi:hypothetical protein